MIYSKSKEERSKLSEEHDLERAFRSNWANHSGKLCNANGRNHYWFSQGQKKEYLNRMRETQFRDTSADTEWIKCNVYGIKTGSSKNADLLKVKRRHSWTQWSNKIQQHFCWNPVNHCYKCTKQKIIANKHKKKIRHLEILGNIKLFADQVATS